MADQLVCHMQIPVAVCDECGHLQHSPLEVSRVPSLLGAEEDLCGDCVQITVELVRNCDLLVECFGQTIEPGQHQQ